MATNKTQKAEVIKVDPTAISSSPEVKKKVFAGARSVSLAPRKFRTIGTEFAKMNFLRSPGAALALEDVTNGYKYIIDVFPYGKKAYSTIKSFVCNELEIEGMTEAEQEDLKGWFASVTPLNTGHNEDKELLFYLLRKVLIQGGVGFWFNILSENEMNLVDIPFHSVNAKFNPNKNKWGFDSVWINMGLIKNSLPPEEQKEIVNCSDLAQFSLYFYDVDTDTATPIPYFSGAYCDSLTETLWRFFLQKVVTKMAPLKFLHWKVGEPDKIPAGAKFELVEEFENLSTGDPKLNEGAIKAVSRQVNDGSAGVVAYKGITDEQARSQYGEAFAQANAVTDKFIELNTLSTMESPGHFQIIGSEIRRCLASALRVPAQLLELSESRTETQIGSEIDIFLETVEELRSFLGKILTDIAKFRAAVQGKGLPVGFKVTITPSKRAEELKKNQAEKAKEEIRGLKLDNLNKVKLLGMEITPEFLDDLDYPVKFKKAKLVELNKVNPLNANKKEEEPEEEPEEKEDVSKETKEGADQK